MEPGGSMPHSQRLSSNPHPELNQPSWELECWIHYSYWTGQFVHKSFNYLTFILKDVKQNVIRIGGNTIHIISFFQVKTPGIKHYDEISNAKSRNRCFASAFRNFVLRPYPCLFVLGYRWIRWANQELL